ncbi:MAG TPA: methyltransferase domain-containing protein [Methylomirabilota bacterium]|nr:methyltransferase domain-containing protein [Methylomirabilota bacterium]
MKSIQRRCPVCDGSESQPELTKAELALVRCMNCSMVYASPVSAAYVDGSYYEDAGRPFYLSPAKLRGDYSPVRFARELRLFRRFCVSGRVLDVGCSTGAFLYQLNQRYPGAYDAIGTDVSSPALDYAEQQGVTIRRKSFLDADWATGEFDAVTFWAVLEHVSEPRAFLEQAVRVLKPGGICFVLVPNYRSLAVRILGARYRYILPQHLNYFTRETLRRAAPAGLHPVYFTTMHFNPAVILKDLRGQAAPSDSERAELLTKTTALKENRWLLPLRWGYAGAEQLLQLVGLCDNAVWVFRKS